MDDAAMLKKKGYKLGRHLGEGSYAKVKSAYSYHLKCKVAVKIIDRKKAPVDFAEKFLPREMEILPILNHNSIIKLHETFESKEGKVYIILELAVNGDLLDFIKTKGSLAEESAHKMFYQLVTAVKYCHDMNIVHRDLKCENVLLDQDLNIKLSDFGFGRRMIPSSLGHSNLSKTFCGSSAYAAPEILQGIPYRPKLCDIWSLGVILYIMVCGSMPYDDTDIKKMLRVQKEHRVKFPHSKHLSKNCKDLICQMLQPDVMRRVTAAEILDHSWFLPPEKLKAHDATEHEVESFADHTEVKKEEAAQQTPTTSTAANQPTLESETGIKLLQQKVASMTLHDAE